MLLVVKMLRSHLGLHRTNFFTVSHGHIPSDLYQLAPLLEIRALRHSFRSLYGNIVARWRCRSFIACQLVEHLQSLQNENPQTEIAVSIFITRLSRNYPKIAEKKSESLYSSIERVFFFIKVLCFL